MAASSSVTPQISVHVGGGTTLAETGWYRCAPGQGLTPMKTQRKMTRCLTKRFLLRCRAAQRGPRLLRSMSPTTRGAHMLPAMLMSALVCGLLPAETGAIEAPRPNVILVMVDDLRVLDASHLPPAVTPNLERLRARGMSFERAYVQVPVCNPGRTSFLTGLRPDSTGVQDNKTFYREIIPDVVTLPEVLAKRGYFTATIGKVFHKGEKWLEPGMWDLAVFPETTSAARTGTGRNMCGGVPSWCRWLASKGSDSDFGDGRIGRMSASFLDEIGDQKFFLAVGFHRPHSPYLAPERYFQIYRLDQFDPLPSMTRDLASTPLALGSQEKIEIFSRLKKRDRREFLRAYYATVSFMDAQLGIILDAMDRLDLWENTLFIFLSDHGYHLGEQGWWDKNTLFEPSVQTPFIAYAPGMKGSGRSSRRLIELVDIYPTVVDYCRLKSPHRLDGVSLRPLLDKPRKVLKKAAFSQVLREVEGEKVFGRSVRTKRWRYTEWDEGRSGIELYDHKRDPGETSNLAGDPDYAGREASLRSILRTGPLTPE